MKDLDLLEKNILKAIEQSSVFSITEIRFVYEKCESFDTTINILKNAANKKISLNDSLSEFRFNS